ncbi:MAG: peptidoglycan DD-metalloendopeptidase family protein [Deltaproteobacteria bacterium]|nr:peptidoglycan DD-metalloendopeptidase family protein [Deltaproteobacteria bacterium]
MAEPISAASMFVPTVPSGDETRRRLAGKRPDEVAKEFEAVLLAQVISAMRKTVPESGMLQASANRKMLDGAFDQEVARSLAAKGGLGIAEQIVAQIERQHPGTIVAAKADGTVAAAARAARPLGRTASAAPGAPAGAAAPPAAATSPLAGAISSPFGMRSDPFTGERRFHAGVDVAAPRGAEIRSVADGEVVFSGWRRGGAGRMVEVRHADGLVTSYAHAERTLVRAGQHVVAGEVVATVGSSGRASGPHLHFAASRDGQAVDPTALLGGGGPVLGAAAPAAGVT